MAQPPFERAARQSSEKPGSPDRLTIDRGTALGAALRTVVLFEGRRLTDIALQSRAITKRGAVSITRGIHGAQATTGLIGTLGTDASPCFLLSPKDAATAAFTVSAMVRFNGAGPEGGSFGSIGAALAVDDGGQMPLYVSVAAGTFRARAAAEAEFLSGGQPLLASSLSGWHRLTATVSGSTATLYVDGGLTWVGTASLTFSNFVLRALLGSDVTNGTAWPWPTADLFYWSRALIEDEVAAHYRRPYGMLRDRLSERWLTPVVIPEAADPGDAWDDVFTDDFGPDIAFGVIAQTQGAGQLMANATVARQTIPTPTTITIGGTGFLQADSGVTVVKYVTATLAGSGLLFADGKIPRPHADFFAVGSLVASTRQLHAAVAIEAGAGSLAAVPGVRSSVRAAQQGNGTLVGNPVILEPFNRGRATFSGAGTLTANARVVGAPLQAAILSGAGQILTGSLTLRGAARSKINGNARLIAKPRVRKRPRMLPGIATGVEPEIVAVEIETYVPGNLPTLATRAHGTRAHGTLARQPPTRLEITQPIRASDIGYRTSPADGGPVTYPPLLTDAYQIDASLTLEPTRTAAAAAWGTVLLANAEKQFDGIILENRNSDGRSVKLLVGKKRFDMARQYLTDPSYAALSVLFSGLATPWTLNDDGLQVPLRDATYYLEKPLQTDTYGGTGALDGTSDLAGKPKPMTRGGTTSAPIQNVTPILVDPVNRIYQYSDAPGLVVALYESAAANSILYAGDTTNLYAGATPAGRYRTDNSRGLFQLGSVPVGQITVDVAGQFVSGGAVNNPFLICLHLLTEDMALPQTMIDIDSFTTAAAATPAYVSGLYFGSDTEWSCIQAIDSAFASIGANLIPTRDGRLRVMLLREIASTEHVSATYTEAQILSLTRRPLPTTLDPPPYRFRIGYSHNYTTMTQINTTLATADRQQFVQSPDRFATWVDASLLSAYRRPNDFSAMPGPLLTQAAAQDVANSLGALWGTKRRLYDVTLPRRLFGPDIGDVVHIQYPIELLGGGQDGRIVGYSLRAQDGVVAYTVLV